MTVTERFLDYVRLDTQSCEDSPSAPSTPGQTVFANYLKEQLLREGLHDVVLDGHGCLYATLPPSSARSAQWPTIGFIAHYDTSPECSGADTRPRIVEHYDGTDIVLGNGLTLSPEMFPELAAHVGDDIIVTDGRTLLGADDKAGIAETVQAMAWLKAHPEVEHGKVRIAFTPDEEIGRGTDHFDVEHFGCQWAYTIDGGEVGELECENFNAAAAKVSIRGVSVHPGYAKGKMVNAALLAAEFVSQLPPAERPENTEGYEGFYHVTAIAGNCSEATVQLIIRDHDSSAFESRKQLVRSIASKMNAHYGEGTLNTEIHDQYRNMKEMIAPCPHVVDLAVKAMRKAGVEPRVQPIRGGTDGAQLSFRGLPCPNIFAGGLNFHGPYECIPIQSMQKAVEVIIDLLEVVRSS